MRGEFEETEALDRQALALSLQLNGPKAIETAIEARAVAGALLAQGDGAAAEPLLRDHLAVLTWAYGPQSEHLSRGVGLLRAALELQGNADPELETLDERFFRPAKLRQLADPGHASVLYRLRISSPGEYRLFLRWDGHDIMSDSLWAQLLELQDGPGGKSADGYAFIMPLLGGDADFATFPTWMGFADFEENAHSQWREHPFDVPATWTVPASGDYTLRITAFKGGTAFDAAILQLTNLPAPTGDGPAESAIATDGAFLEQNGGVVFEAEHFASRTQGEAIEAPLTIEWWVIPGEDPGDLAYLHYRGAGYVQALPDGTVDDPAELLHNRAFVQAQEGHYPEAIAYYSQAVQAAPDDLRNYYQLALACLGAGRLEAYRQAVARMRAQSGAEDPGLVPARIPGTYALGPQAVVDYAPIIAMAEEAIRRNPADPGRLSALRALGAVLYRAGRHSEALQRLAEAQAGLERLVSSLKSSSRAYAAYFQAMAHQRLGQPAEARQWFERARGWRQAFRSAVPATKPIAWIRRLPLDLLQREAADRLGAAATP
jgi:tetratricopeptide (TPR) repeat protein